MFLKRRSASVIFGLFMLAVAAVPLQTVRADMAPKPTMEFEFVYEISPAPSIVSGIQEECGEADCLNAYLLQKGGPQQFTCTRTDCFSVAYSYSEFQRLKITFSDGITRQSNVFSNKYLSNTYLVTVRETDLLIAQRWSGPALFSSYDDGYGSGTYSLIINSIFLCIFSIPVFLVPGCLMILIAVRSTGFRNSWAAYISAWLLSLLAIGIYSMTPFIFEGLLATLVIEIALAVGYVLWRKRQMVLLLTVVAIMNLLTRPLLAYFVGAFYDLRAAHLIWILLGEILVWIAEACILALALRKETGFREASSLSLVLNAASFGIGLLLPF